jgi:3'(2'), 5'-bisphosphate nucleotidase
MIHTSELLENVIQIALDASKIVMKHYNNQFIEIKEDNSPVTQADKETDFFIKQQLQKLTPDVDIVTEESPKNENTTKEYFWLVDPIDGTKEYIKKTGDFTVNIGLIKNSKPVMGVIVTPINNKVWAGLITKGAFCIENNKRRNIKVRNFNKNNLIVVASKNHRSPELEEYINYLNPYHEISVGSSLKFCAIAEGHADIYPRLGTTMEWDTAAGHAILIASGGSIMTYDNKEFLYNKKNFKNPWFVAKGKI